MSLEFDAEHLAHCLLLAAVWGGRSYRRDKAEAYWRDVWALYAQLGCPPLPCTASWFER